MSLKKQLTTPYDIDETIISLTITSFAFDINDSLVHIGYAANNSLGIFQNNMPLTLSGADFTAFVARVNELGATLSGVEAEMQAALENIPGAGTITGDTKVLTTPYNVIGTVIGYDLDSYAFSVEDRLIHIGYSKLETISSTLQTDVLHVLSGQEYDNFLTRFDELELTMSVSQAKIQTCLEFLPGKGIIVDV